VFLIVVIILYHIIIVISSLLLLCHSFIIIHYESFIMFMDLDKSYLFPKSSFVSSQIIAFSKLIN